MAALDCPDYWAPIRAGADAARVDGQVYVLPKDLAVTAARALASTGGMLDMAANSMSALEATVRAVVSPDRRAATLAALELDAQRVARETLLSLAATRSQAYSSLLQGRAKVYTQAALP